jgi:rare lipoprotein A
MQRKLLKVRLKVWRQIIAILMVSVFVGASPALLAKEKTSQKSNHAKNTGIASYYAAKFNGRRTASGEIFDNTLMTAAHRSLPFGTFIQVTNLRNNKSVIVRINDRGPYAKGRIIDLTKAAAKKIGVSRSGVARVKLEVLKN